MITQWFEMFFGKTLGDMTLMFLFVLVVWPIAVGVILLLRKVGEW